MSDYRDFIARKHIRTAVCGFEPREDAIPAGLFDWQKESVRWACRTGRAAIFASCGMGKTAMQLAWARQIAIHAGGPVLILAPLAIGRQTEAEGRKFGVEARYIRSMDAVDDAGIYIMNYEMLEHVEPGRFAGIVLDESSILKALMGKTRNLLIAMFQCVPYRLCCTATPAPNDYTELGNHAEFLGAMTMNEMLSTWFVNDGFQAGKWRIKGHAKSSFWEWLASWAVCMNKPSDLGPQYSDESFRLPALVTVKHILPSTMSEGESVAEWMRHLAAKPSASTLKKEMRRTLAQRVAEAARIVREDLKPDEQCLVWCELNDESSALAQAIPGAVEVTGSMKNELKEQRMLDFASGKIRVLVSKPKICGFGMNFQSCHQMIFVGMSFSFEGRYQAIRRCWRFGQTHDVYDHVVLAGQEERIFKAVAEKERAYIEMEESMAGTFSQTAKSAAIAKKKYDGRAEVKAPSFLRRAS